ncbi:hypothetical protein DFH09DRAFT_1278668 [Mycena vulgaris]|nr:hypothetical protein DFH09DRAFT_1278668 [Mycena vulgaris]
MPLGSRKKILHNTGTFDSIEWYNDGTYLVKPSIDSGANGCTARHVYLERIQKASAFRDVDGLGVLQVPTQPRFRGSSMSPTVGRSRSRAPPTSLRWGSHPRMSTSFWLSISAPPPRQGTAPRGTSAQAGAETPHTALRSARAVLSASLPPPPPHHHKERARERGGDHFPSLSGVVRPPLRPLALSRCVLATHRLLRHLGKVYGGRDEEGRKEDEEEKADIGDIYVWRKKRLVRWVGKEEGRGSSQDGGQERNTRAGREMQGVSDERNGDTREGDTSKTARWNAERMGRYLLEGAEDGDKRAEDGGRTSNTSYRVKRSICTRGGSRSFSSALFTSLALDRRRRFLVVRLPVATHRQRVHEDAREVLAGRMERCARTAHEGSPHPPRAWPHQQKFKANNQQEALARQNCAGAAAAGAGTAAADKIVESLDAAQEDESKD